MAAALRLYILGSAHRPFILAVDCDAITLDFSHASLAGRDSLEFALAMGRRLRHVHRCDGPGSMGEGYLFEEHRLPGHGTQPVAKVLQYFAGLGWNGCIIAEVNARNAVSDRERLGMLVEARTFTQQHLASPRPVLPKRAKSDSAGRNHAHG